MTPDDYRQRVTDLARVLGSLRMLRLICAVCESRAQDATVSMADPETVRVVIRCHGSIERRLVAMDAMFQPGYVPPLAFIDQAAHL